MAIPEKAQIFRTMLLASSPARAIIRIKGDGEPIDLPGHPAPGLPVNRIASPPSRLSGPAMDKPALGAPLASRRQWKKRQ
jgi:hypothetical protein